MTRTARSSRPAFLPPNRRAGTEPATRRAPRAPGNGLSFHYAIGKSRVGPVLVALSPRGLCQLWLLDSGGPDPVAKLQRQHPSAELVEDAPRAAPVLRQLDEFLAGKRKTLDVALDLHGTPFQQRVWQALQQIPRGQTWSYSDVARQVGKPRAVRAVGNACGKNPVALVVPCHRVLRKDGSLGGYGSGLGTKEKLLRLEGVGA